MSEEWILPAWIVSNVVAILMIVVSVKSSVWGRVLFVLLFLWAGQLNLRTAISQPETYLDYADYAWVGVYREFILGFFARHTTLVVGTIAAGQLTVAVLVGLRGRAVTLGLWGAILFFVSILPLGVGSGFPTTLSMAVAALVLNRREHADTLLGALVETRRVRGLGGVAADERQGER